jgi:hypothetical protein
LYRFSMKDDFVLDGIDTDAEFGDLAIDAD